MELIFLFGTVQSFFLSLLIFSKKRKSAGDYVLGAWLIFLGLHLMDSYFHFSGLAWRYPHLIGLGHTFPILHGPFLFVYVLVMISETGRFKVAYLIHGIPFFASTLFLLLDFFFMNAPEKLVFLNRQLVHLTSPYRVIWIFKVFLGPVYVIGSLVKLNEHKKNMAGRFSYSEHVNLTWLKFVVIGLGVVWFMVLATVSLRLFFRSMTFVMGDYVIYLSLTAVIFFLGYFGFRQRGIYTDEFIESKYSGNSGPNGANGAAERRVEERYRKSGLDSDTAKNHLHDLRVYMEKEKPFLNGKLNLRDVADHLGISTNHLSQVINGQAGMSFFDFVNQYRVDEVLACLADPRKRQLKLIAIAFDCGFNSKSSFNSIFKKKAGLTPTQYVKNYSRKRDRKTPEK